MTDMQHKFCEKCIDERHIQGLKDSGLYKQQEKIVLGSRHMPSYIMFDGEGKYGKKQMQEHQNLRVQIGYNWNYKDETPREDTQNNTEKQLTSISSIDALPRLYNRKRMFDVPPMKPSILSSDHLKRFGKFSQRYSQKSDIFGNKNTDYSPTSEKYGQFYLSQEKKQMQKVDVRELKSFEEDKPNYNYFPPEKPILTYHSMKSQLFKQKQSQQL